MQRADQRGAGLLHAVAPQLDFLLIDQERVISSASDMQQRITGGVGEANVSAASMKYFDR